MKESNMKSQSKLEMWANAQRDGRPAEQLNIGGALCSMPQFG